LNRHARPGSWLLVLFAAFLTSGCMESCTGTPTQPFEVLAVKAPGEGAAGVFTNTSLLLELAHAVDSSSITEASAYLAEIDPAGMETGVTVDVARVVPESAPRFLVLDPVSDLLGSTRYVARLNSAVRSRDGAALPDYHHPFTTAPAGDQVFHPVVSSFSPAEGEVIECAAPVVIRFGAGTPIDPRTIDETSVTLATPVGLVAYRMEYAPTSITLRPILEWTSGAAHTLTLDGARILNLWGQTLLAGPDAGLQLHFTVASPCRY
jgi:hypothetical protein